MATYKQAPIDEWQARDAADTLARAEAIKANKALHTAAKGSAAATIAKLQTVVDTPSNTTSSKTKVASPKPQVAKGAGPKRTK